MAFSDAFKIKKPDVIVLDVIFKADVIEYAEIFDKLKKEQHIFPPLIFISSRNDMEARLICAKLGA